ncbi:MAG: biotin/lipoyl-binding protein, partial [Proteobacteria bacterium]|nr:biotin/lipoyl-binding protein [Pseudomonadota bacterium]
LTAPMPCRVTAVHVKSGARVKRGQALLVLEAMKMEHTINAPSDGIAVEVRPAVGDQVEEGVTLVVFEVD